MPAVRIADWLDKAEAAIADVEEVSLADLRAVVTSAGDVAREERTKEMASRLREALERRGAVEHEQWIGDVKVSLQHGRVVRALRLASRAPDPTQLLPDDVLESLKTAASGAMTAEIAPDRFATLLDAVAYSPVRRDVDPAGVPAEPGDELLAAVRKHAGRAPAIAARFGIEAPPPKERGRRQPKAPRPVDKPQPAGPPVDVGGRKIPPPPRPPKAAEAESLEPPAGAPSAPGGETVEATEPMPEPVPEAVDPPAVADVPAVEPAPPTPIGEDAAGDAAVESAGEQPDPEIQ